MYATNYFETQILNAMRNITFTAPATVYIGLFLSNPTETGQAGTEMQYPGYQRQSITFTSPAPESGGIGIKNDTQVNFPVPPSDAGQVKFIGILDSETAGNMLAFGELTEYLTVGSGEPPVLEVNEVIYYLTGDLSTAYKTKVLNVLRGQNLVGVVTHFALYNGDPEVGGSELTGANYARVPIQWTAPSEQSSGQMQIENSVATQFNRPTAGWGNWSYNSIFDALVGGECVWKQSKTPSKQILKGYMPTIAQGDVKAAVN